MIVEICPHCDYFSECDIKGHRFAHCESCHGECWECLSFLDYYRNI
ncbi:MAG: hypothetical protein JSW06_07215 [Thermoplasmatales archaeon]|nr:MAG: hypothetical protein JSW06_07215 [Thermoplasmatales archaeon]